MGEISPLRELPAGILLVNLSCMLVFQGAVMHPHLQFSFNGEFQQIQTKQFAPGYRKASGVPIIIKHAVRRVFNGKAFFFK
ncbi:MAG: hypothetical protein ACOX37_00475 [Bacillota bacterium]